MRTRRGFHKGALLTDETDVGVYLLVAFGVTWLLLAPLALEGAGVVGGPVPGVLHVFGGVGPALAAAAASRRAGLPSAWWRGLRRAPSEASSWLLAAGVPVALLVVGLLTVGGPEDIVASVPAESWAWGVVVGVSYGVLEEAGWRGYLLPRLQNRHSAVTASVLLGVIHVVWHAPMFLYRYPLGVGSVLGFSTSLVAATVFFTHLYNRSGGSALVTMVFHVGWNVAILVGARGSGEVAAVMSVGLMLLAGLVILRYGGGTLASGPAVRLGTAPARKE